MDIFGIVKGGLIKGKVFWDENVDCLVDSIELLFENWVIWVVGDLFMFFGCLDVQGYYWIFVDVFYDIIAGYMVIIIFFIEYWQVCVNDVLMIVVYQDFVVVDFLMGVLVECLFLYVDIIGVQ